MDPKNDPDLESDNPDIRRAAEKRAAALAADRGETTDTAEVSEPKKAKSRRQTTRG